MKTTITTPVIQTATKELVESLLASNTSNRPIRPSVVASYKGDIADGNWLITNQGIGVSSDGVLIDGQHRLEALRQMGYPPVRLLIVYGLPREAQKVIDQHARRGFRDVLRLFIPDTSEDADSPDGKISISLARQAPAVCNVIYRATHGWGYGRVSYPKFEQVLYDHLPELRFILNSTRHYKFFAAPYLAAFVVVAKEQPLALPRIAEFIKSVEVGENLMRNMPEFHLRNHIMSSAGTGGGGGAQTERFEKARKALEAAIAQKEIKQLRGRVKTA